MERYSQKRVLIGKPKLVHQENSIILEKPKRKFRILIQEKTTTNGRMEKMRSFMVYDYYGNSTVDSIKDKLHKLLGNSFKR